MKILMVAGFKRENVWPRVQRTHPSEPLSAGWSMEGRGCSCNVSDIPLSGRGLIDSTVWWQPRGGDITGVLRCLRGVRHTQKSRNTNIWKSFDFNFQWGFFFGNVFKTIFVIKEIEETRWIMNLMCLNKEELDAGCVKVHADIHQWAHVTYVLLHYQINLKIYIFRIFSSYLF